MEIVRITLTNDPGGLTGGANGIFGIARPEIFGMKIRKGIDFYYLIWGGVGVTVLLFWWLHNSRFGRALSCIREDDIAAEGCGIDVAHYKLMAFVLGAFWAGMTGTLFAAKMTIISPSSFTFWDSVLLFAVICHKSTSFLKFFCCFPVFRGKPNLRNAFLHSRCRVS